MLTPTPLPRTIEASFRDLGSQKAATRASAIRDVVRHSARSDATRARAIPHFEKALRDDRSPAVRAEAALALADVAASEALPILLVAVEDEDSHVRQMAISALGEIGDLRAVHRLERALRDQRPEVRYQAVIAFARVAKNDPAAVAGALLHALDDEDSAIRYIAMRVAEEGLAVDSGAAPFRAPAIVDNAQRFIEGVDDALAVAAALYLTRTGSERGRRLVLDVVAEVRSTPEIEDVQGCIELVGELGLREAIEHLERRVWGSRRLVRSLLSWGAGDSANCSWHARIALARMGHERARAEIVADLASWRRETRDAAVVAAGRARIREARTALENLGDSVDDALVREALVRLAVE